MLKGLIEEKKIKTMNNKMAKNTYLSTIESEKLSKQEEQRQNHGYRVFCWLPDGRGGMREWVKR